MPLHTTKRKPGILPRRDTHKERKGEEGAQWSTLHTCFFSLVSFEAFTESSCSGCISRSQRAPAAPDIGMPLWLEQKLTVSLVMARLQRNLRLKAWNAGLSLWWAKGRQTRWHNTERSSVGVPRSTMSRQVNNFCLFILFNYIVLCHPHPFLPHPFLHHPFLPNPLQTKRQPHPSLHQQSRTCTWNKRTPTITNMHPFLPYHLQTRRKPHPPLDQQSPTPPPHPLPPLLSPPSKASPSILTHCCITHS